MKKLVKSFGMMLMATMMTFGICACDGDSSNDGGDWSGDWLVMTKGSLTNLPADIQVLTLNPNTGRFYSTYYLTEDGKMAGGSCAYGKLDVNENKRTMTMNGVTMKYKVVNDKITFYDNSASTSFKRLTAKQKALYADLAKLAKGYVYPYEIEPGAGSVIPGITGIDPNGMFGSVVGMWYQQTGSSSYEITEFKTDNTMTYIELWKSGSKWCKSTDTGTYSVKNNILTIKADGKSTKHQFYSNGAELVIDDTTLKAMTSTIKNYLNSATEV